MAGAGFKTFNTGDVLTASDVNTYLMQQTVMVFASSAARTSALGANVAEGMLSYLKDTDQVEVYNGTSWVASDDPNAIQNTIVDAKGDIITATAADTPARLAAGSNGQSLYADSSTSTGLRWQDDTSVGRNKIINGDFGIWQRGTSISVPDAVNTYGPDRFFSYLRFSAGSASLSQQTFTPGTAPVAGYEGQFFCRITNGSTATYADIGQKIEDVRTFAGQTITFSFWAKASGSIVMQPQINQNFGSGGSSATVNTGSNITLTTSWTRYTATIAIPSISGKTIGTNSFLYATLAYVSGTLNSATIDTWGWQVEAGSVATSFQTATGTKQGELAACQRYYYRQTSGTTYGTFATGTISSTTGAYCGTTFPVQMRVAPTSFEYSSLRVTDKANFGVAVTSASLSTADTTPNLGMAQYIVASGLTAYRPCFIDSNNISTGYIAFNAEL